MRGARAREASWGGGRSGDAAERRDGAAARPKNSGGGSKVTGCTGSTTATPAGASPPCRSPGWLHGDERAATTAETGSSGG
jgi:hypothetical protein